MQTRVEKRPDGVAVIVPEPMAANFGLTEDGVAEIEWNQGRLVVRPQKRKSLAELLEKVTDENIHDEVDFGPPVGRELL